MPNSVKLPPDVTDPEVVHRLEVAPLEVPGEGDFKPRVDVADAKRFSDEILVLLGGMSQMEQLNDWQTDVLQLQNRQLRAIEAELVRRETILKNIQAKQTEQGQAFGFGKWMLVVLTSGFVAAFLKTLVDLYFRKLGP